MPARCNSFHDQSASIDVNVTSRRIICVERGAQQGCGHLLDQGRPIHSHLSIRYNEVPD
jgi:hypothetical protein